MPDRSAAEPVIAGRYQPTLLLKEGLGVQTFRGVDLHDGGAVVIKLARPAVSAGARVRLEHEATVLRQVTAGVAPVLEVGNDGDLFYVVTRYVRGMTLEERIARGGPLSVPDAVAVGLGIMSALEAAHGSGVVHRDVKPSNVVVGSGSPPEPVTLIDFGLARSGNLEASLRDLPVGTIAYVSPEQAGLIDVEVGERSDLYSAGIVLFECLAGRPPFEGPSVGELLRQHLAIRPPELRELGQPVPRALDGVIQRLLEKDPRDRYQSAAAAAADLRDIATALDRGIREPVVSIGAHDRRRVLTDPAFVARERELRTVEEQLARAAAGEPVLLLVEGESGVGKTALLDRIAVAARHRGALLLRAVAERVAPRPLQAIERIADQVVAAARHDPALLEALRDRLGDHAETLCRAAPTLAEIFPGRAGAAGPEAYGRPRTIAAMAALIDALGAASRMAVVLLDDCQWLAEGASQLLVEWHRSNASGSRPTRVLLVAAYRTEDLSGDSPLHALTRAPRISLGPLAPDDVRRLAESMSGPLPSDAIAVVQRLSEGNPFLAAAVVEGLVERGKLTVGVRGWELEPDAIADAQSSHRAASFLARRLDTMPAPALRILSAGAVLGRSFELDLASRFAGQSTAESMAAIAEARRRRVVWLDPIGSRCTFVHDRLRDAILSYLDPDARRRLHRLAAAALELDGRPDPERAFDLAYHLDEAGERLRALPHALSAASQARARYALELAERQYRIAARSADDRSVDADTRRRAAEGLGDVLLLRGRYDEAMSWLAQARALATAPTARAAIEGKIGELAFKRGEVRSAADALERALRTLGHRVPRGTARLAWDTARLALVQIVHTILPSRLVSRRRLEDGAADLLAARLFSRLAYVSWFLRGQMATFWAHLSGLNLAERYPPTRELAQAYSEHSISVTGLPRVLFGRGVRYAERGLAIRRALGDSWGQGQSLNFYGLLLYAFGRYPAALKKLREAHRVLRRTGDRWEANVAGVHVAFCLYRLGELRDAIAQARRIHREGLEIGDRHATAMALEVWSKASGGAVPAELVDAALAAAEEDPLTRELLLQAAGARSIGAGRPQEAAAAFGAAERSARSAHLRNEYVSYVAVWMAHAWRLSAVQAAADTGVFPSGPLREARRALRRGVRNARRHRGNLPMALRERALLRAMRGGRWRQVRRDLDESLSVAERQGAHFEIAQTRLARGEIGRARAWPGADEEAAQARRALREMGAEFACSPTRALAPDRDAPVTLSLADRFGQIVDQGGRIASALTPEDVYEALCEAAVVLLRGDATVVLAADERHASPLARRGEPVEISRSLVARALRERRPVLSTELLDDGFSDSLVLPRPHSAACAPILVRDRPAACLYVTHALVRDVQGSDDAHIAAYLAKLAGASLEKAEAFAEVKELSRTLLASNDELDANLQRLRETQEQLVQAAKMAAAGTLLAGLSHELNNPLSVILGNARLTLERTAADDPRRRALSAIERQARRCTDIVRSFLDFFYKRPLELEVVPIEELIRQVGALASSKLHRQDVQLELEIPPAGACNVRVARAQIESALLNLVGNAVDASPRGTVVRIEAVPREREHRSGVEVSVRDHGTGIDPDVLSRVFEPFFTTKAKGTGTGLGLSLSREFIVGHGGDLSIESRVGEGTAARVWLPVVGAQGTVH